jgi:hypothetical protein
LTVQDRLVTAVERTGATETLTGPILAARWTPWDALPPSKGRPISAAGVVILSDADRDHLFPIDDWWMSPTPPSTGETALRSSGFSTLVEELDVPLISAEESETPPPLRDPLLHVPQSRRIDLIARRLGLATALLLAGTVLLGPLLLVVVGRALGWEPEFWVWVCCGASAVGTVFTLVVCTGRVRTAPETTGSVVRPVAGPKWFRRRATLWLSDRGALQVDAGRGVALLLAAPGSTLSPSAVVRARRTGGSRPRLLVLDAEDVVRAELPLSLWPEEPVTALLVQAGTVIEQGRDRRSARTGRMDPLSRIEEPGLSLVAPTSLGVLPLLSPLRIAVLQLMVAAVAASELGGFAQAATATALFSSSVCIMLITAAVELGSRLPQVEAPSPASAQTILRLVIWHLAAAAVAAFFLMTGDWGTGGYAILVGLAGAPFVWVLYRHRAVGERRGILPFSRWLRAGCPR